jgi:hypothetical protein
MHALMCVNVMRAAAIQDGRSVVAGHGIVIQDGLRSLRKACWVEDDVCSGW